MTNNASEKISQKIKNTIHSEERKKEHVRKTQWHTPFCASMHLEFNENRDELVYYMEYPLNIRPIMIDLLVLKKKPEATIKNELGKNFRKYNIFEYKSIADALNLDVFLKTIGYACFLKVHGMDGKSIRLSDITITFVRKSKPVKLLKELKKLGISCQRESQGVYRLKGFTLFPIQIIVTKELDIKEHMWLTALNGTIAREEAERLVKEVEHLDTHAREYANAVLQIAMKRNRKLFENMKEELNMNYVLELFRPEIEEKMKKERVEGRKEERDDLFRIVQKLREGEAVEQLMADGMDLESIKFVQKVLL